MVEQLLLLAFGAGVLGFFAPCSVAMLPAYIAYFLGQKDLGFADRPPSPFRDQVGGLGLLVAAAGLSVVLWTLGDLAAVLTGESRIRGLQVVAMSLGAAILFGGLYLAAPRRGVFGGLTLGVVTSLGLLATYLVLGLGVVMLLQIMDFRQMAAAVLVIAAAMILLGILGFFGRGLSFTVPIKAPRRRSMFGFFLFGIAYGVVSLGCNLPLIGFPVVAAAASAGVGGGMLGFLAYGAGASLLMIVLSVGVGSGHGLTATRLRRVMPWLGPLQNTVFILAGAYIIYYYFNVLSL